MQIRRSEALYMAVVLRNTLQKSGNWGSVWVTPKETTVADLAVTAKILHSDGDQVRLHVVAKDATGRVWVNRNYEMATAAGAFNRKRYPDLDPYQDVFNEIANDLAVARDKLTAEQRRDLRGVSGMRYAADVSPDAFKGYVADDGKGRYTLNRLPAADDPMYGRTQSVRQRERLFLDTLDEHYEKFYVDAGDSYNSWRENSREEAIEDPRAHEAGPLAHGAGYRNDRRVRRIRAKERWQLHRPRDPRRDDVCRLRHDPHEPGAQAGEEDPHRRAR